MKSVRRAILAIALASVTLPHVGGASDALGAETDVMWAAQAGPVPDSLDGEAYMSLRGRRVTVYFVQGQAALAERMRTLLDGQPPLPALPDSIPHDVHAVLAHSPAALDELTGGVVPEWRAGVAIPSQDMLIIPSGEGAGALSGGDCRWSP